MRFSLLEINIQCGFPRTYRISHPVLSSSAFREPDSNYFDLPQSTSHSNTEVTNRTEVNMDVYQMRNMNQSIMVGVL